VSSAVHGDAGEVERMLPCAGYASVLLAAGKRTAARVQAKKAMGIYKQTLGDGHPDTIAAATLMSRSRAPSDNENAVAD